MLKNQKTFEFDSEKTLATAAVNPAHFAPLYDFPTAKEFGKAATRAGVGSENSAPIVRTSSEANGINISDRRLALSQLARLVANVTEAYSVVVFIADGNNTLRPEGVHTLSRDFDYDCAIPFGCGLVGWTAENGVRISVCPFEHDATTLLYYKTEQDLKSFIAVPIIGSDNRVLGAISVDSKKSYSFAKVTEKILLDCATQAATTVELLNQVQSHRCSERVLPESQVLEMLEGLRWHNDENSLLGAVAKLPHGLISRDALVVLSTSESGVGSGKFYSNSVEESLGNRLLDLVCKHKKVLCKERSVHAKAFDDSKDRSFLSVPFLVLGREAGSLNMLSKPMDAFSASEIAAAEKTAQIVGRELERLRLKDQQSISNPGSLLPWKHFQLRARSILADSSRHSNHTLLRLEFSSIAELEDFVGAAATIAAMERVFRLVAQVARNPAITTALPGNQVLILCETQEASVLLSRLERLLVRINASDIAIDQRIANSPSIQVGALLVRGMITSAAQCGKEGDSIEQLIAYCKKNLLVKPELKEVANAGNW